MAPPIRQRDDDEIGADVLDDLGQAIEPAQPDGLRRQAFIRRLVVDEADDDVRRRVGRVDFIEQLRRERPSPEEKHA